MKTKMVQWLADAYSRLPKACIGSSCARCYKASVVLRLNAVFFFLLVCFILLLFVYFVKFQHFSHNFVSCSFFHLYFELFKGSPKFTTEMTSILPSLIFRLDFSRLEK